MKHRRWNYFRAAIGQYFWLPCPSCQQMFGGHEWKNGTIRFENTGQHWAICPDCEDAGKGEPHGSLLMPRLDVCVPGGYSQACSCHPKARVK